MCVCVCVAGFWPSVDRFSPKTSWSCVNLHGHLFGPVSWYKGSNADTVTDIRHLCSFINKSCVSLYLNELVYNYFYFKARIAKRDRKLVDYDSARHTFAAVNKGKKKEGPVKASKVNYGWTSISTDLLFNLPCPMCFE